MKNYHFIYDNYNVGFADENNNIICECKYAGCNYFEDGFALVTINNHIYGYINVLGIEVVKCEYCMLDAKLLLEKYKLNLKRIQQIKSFI